ILMGHRSKRSTIRVPRAEPVRTSRANPSDRCRSLSAGVPTVDAQTFEQPLRSSDGKSTRLADTFGPQRWIPAHVDPFGGLCRYMTAAAISLVIGRRSLRRIPGIEPGPSPTFTPEPVAGMPPRGVPDHDEPPLQDVRVAYRSGGHGRGGRLEHLFDEDRAVREMSCGFIGRRRARRCVDDMNV